MKIQFIVVGWYYTFMEEFNNGLKQLNDSNENVNVFWSCHNEPTDWIKENFDYKVFDNIGDEYGAFQQATDHQRLEFY